MKRRWKPHWKEGSTLQLIAALQKVEDEWGGPEVWHNEDEKWLVVAAELPRLTSDLEVPENERTEIPNICKGRFHTLCWYFNVAVRRSTRPSTRPTRDHRCLTVKVKSALRHYAFRSSPLAVSPGIALSKHVNRELIIPYGRIPDEESSNDSADSGISDKFADSGIFDKSTGDQLTKQDTPERQTLEAPVAPSDAEQWERQIFYIRLKQRDFSIGMAVKEFCELYLQFLIWNLLIVDVLFFNQYRIRKRNVARDFMRKIEVLTQLSPFVYQTVPQVFPIIYLRDKDPVILKCIYNGKGFPVKYLPSPKVFSGGWKQFVTKNKFKIGDVLVFCQLDHLTYEVSRREF